MTEQRDTIRYGEMDSPIGPLVLGYTAHGLCNIHFGSYRDVEPELKGWSRKQAGTESWVEDPEAVGEAIGQLNDYFAGRRTDFDLPLDLLGTPFQVKVWNALRSVGYGETASYKQIGLRIGAEKAVRAIGGANNRNPVPIVVPCHRVIGADGSMVGYGGGLHIKTFLLELEGLHHEVR